MNCALSEGMKRERRSIAPRGERDLRARSRGPGSEITFHLVRAAISRFAVLVCALLAIGAAAHSTRSSRGPERATPAARTVRWIAVGGGAEPRSGQVSLEQDVALARSVFGPAGVILFGGGRDALSVQVLRGKANGDPLLRDLGDLLDPREGRDASYRRSSLPIDGPAGRADVTAALRAALAQGDDPLLVYMALHGEQGETARDNEVDLWGGSTLSVADLATLLDRAPPLRQVRLVVASCFSGGFANLAFAAADSERGPAPTPRCGLFASEWNRESSGCDPNPDRRAQEGFSVYFLHALRGEDRAGKPLPVAEIDYDGDGRVSLLEAETRVRIASRSIDVPNTTSERWLRQVAPAAGPSREVSLPEDDAVIRALGEQLGLRGAAAVRKRAEKIDAKLNAIDDELSDQESREAERYGALRAALLGRWPVLDDPWHPDFPATLSEHRAAIRDFLRASPQARAYREADEKLDRLWQRHDQVSSASALVRRLQRAHENRILAGRLRAAGGPNWSYYQRLLTCERSVIGNR
jgi:hypothetical protein